MGDNRDQTLERVPMDLAPTPVLKVEPPRNSPGTALLRTVPHPQQQARFLTTNIQSSSSSSTPVLAKQGNVQSLPTVSGMAPAQVINRLTTLPVQSGTPSSYHVPRGAAAVANIAVPRSSLATPIIRGTSTLQTIGVATTGNQPSYMRATSPASGIVGRGNTSWLGVTTTQPPRQQAHPINNTFTTNRMAVSARIPGTTVSTRPVLLQATPTHKSLSIAQPPSQVHLADKKFIQKGNVMTATTVRTTTPTPGRITVSQPLSRLAPPLRPVLSLQPAVLVSAPTTHSQTTLQIQSAPPSSIAISTRPVSVLTSAVRVTTAPVTAVGVPKVYCQASESSVYIQTSHKQPQGSNVVSIANSLYSLPNTFYDSSSNFRTFTTTPVTTTAVQQSRPSTNQVQGIVSTSQPVRFNPVMVVDSSVHPYAPSESAPTIQSTESSNNASSPTVHIKQNASPRPSILRKRETEGAQAKAAKNLNPLFTTLTVATPSSPPSPPKRPESRGNCGAQSSGGSTTISATSSPGLGTDSPPLKPDVVEEDRPLEMSPRKKPRKQQLTGNQMQEPKFRDEEMEFIPLEKIKKTSREGHNDGVMKHTAKRPVMSLLRNYRPTWKAKHHHFLRYSDVKPKEEKRPSISDIASQKNVLQRVNGWKIYHLGAQMADIVTQHRLWNVLFHHQSDLETEVYDRLTAMLKVLEKKSGKDGDINRVNELIKGNIQRSKVITDQLQEAKCQVMKLFDHKCQVTEMLNRFSSRRSGKKRERV